MKFRLIVATLALAAGTAFAYTPPTDEQVDTLIAKVQGLKIPEGVPEAERTAAVKARSDAVREGLAAMSLNELTLAQIDKLANPNMFVGNVPALEAVAPRLAELAKAPTADGARAAELRVKLMPPVAAPAANTPEEKAKANTAEARAKLAEARTAAFLAVYLDAVNHPGAAELVKSGRGGDVLFGGIGSLLPDEVKKQGLLAKLEPMISPEMSLDALAGCNALVTKAIDEKAGLSKAERDGLLNKVAAAGTNVLGRSGSPVPGKEPVARRAGDAVRWAKSPAARGELLNNPAPEVAFTWSSDGKTKNIAELKGSVVVLDFWATWCGPCVASFPHVRDLVQRYQDAGSPVKVIGVTSLQGFHIKRSLETGNKTERIICKDDPEKEYGLMPSFMKDMNMTWTVGFTPDGCFDPYFGVSGIPHLAIIDAEGKVRHNGLHPMHSKEVADKIDALLKEANLKTPAEPMADPEKKDEKKVSTK